MDNLTRRVTSAVAIGLATSSAAMFATDTGAASAVPPSANSGTTVPLTGIFRTCDFSGISYPNTVGHGQGFALMRAGGANNVVAEVHIAYAQPDAHFDVGLIEEPRPSSSCAPGSAGTAYGGLDTDGGGVGTVTLQDGIRPGAAGAWVIIARPDPHSQTPLEFYTSEYLFPI